MRESTTPLTPEEERLRAFASASPEDIADMVWYESDLIAADVRAVLATFDAARAAAPDGLREAALAAVKATGCIRVFWGARKPCDDPIYNGDRGLCAICALRAALAQSTPEESDRA